jgi:hypothetical protein
VDVVVPSVEVTVDSSQVFKANGLHYPLLIVPQAGVVALLAATMFPLCSLKLTHQRGDRIASSNRIRVKEVV